MLDALGLTLPFAQQAGGGLSQILFMLVAFGAIVYFLMIRPQQQQRKKHEEMIGNIKRGDKVILQGGLYGKVTHVGEEVLSIEIAKDVVVEQVKSMIISVDAKPEPQAKKAAAAKDKAAPAKKAAPKKRTSSRTKAADKAEDTDA